ncbi:ATP-dependent Clp protease proteolytic subunit [Lactococcus nasutitermitis]|uniref:ATP-dependent Clp protease proteolytic subunit n=1 Tax=Lactococcus nasutitermitis TaxID=1652957 RepID=A0ABV9JE88_9LACT|nr:ATP-dependent Clp protease proteolytic subunit [Lactococcus nasutitermitis]
MKKLNFNGVIIPDSLGPAYDYVKRNNITPKVVTSFLEGANGEDILISMSSGGGEITAASDMYTALKKYPGKVNVEITGNSASAATIVMLSADHIAISPSAAVMIHNVQSNTQGDYQELGHEAETTKNLSAGFARMYAQKMNKSVDEVKALMDATTWYNAKQAKDVGLVDEIMFETAPMMVASEDLLLSNDAVSKINALIQSEGPSQLVMKLDSNQMKDIATMVDEKIAAFKAESHSETTTCPDCGEDTCCSQCGYCSHCKKVTNKAKNSADKPFKNHTKKLFNFGGF